MMSNAVNAKLRRFILDGANVIPPSAFNDRLMAVSITENGIRVAISSPFVIVSPSVWVKSIVPTIVCTVSVEYAMTLPSMDDPKPIPASIIAGVSVSATTTAIWWVRALYALYVVHDSLYGYAAEYASNFNGLAGASSSIIVTILLNAAAM